MNFEKPNATKINKLIIRYLYQWMNGWTYDKMTLKSPKSKWKYKKKQSNKQKQQQQSKKKIEENIWISHRLFMFV